MNKTIEISQKTIIFSISIIGGLFFLWYIQDFLFSVFIAFIIMSALKPAVLYLESNKVNHKLAVAIVFILFILSIIAVFLLIVPPLLKEIKSLVENFSQIIDKIGVKQFGMNPEEFINNPIKNAMSSLPSIFESSVSIIGSIFSNVIFIISTLFFSLYLLLEKHPVMLLFGPYFDENKLKKINYLFDEIQERLSAWFWGEITLMFVIGTLTYIGLLILGVRYAVPLAVLAGLFEAIPNIGPISSAIPSILLNTADHGFFSGGSVTILYFIIQQFENTIIVPFIMKKAVGIHPIYTLISLVIGGKIGGVLGVLLAIPTFLVLDTLLREFVHHKGKKY